MNISYNGTLVNYKVVGSGKQNIVYLHGWGGNINSFMFVAQNIKATNILIDFPPFGESQEPKTPWCVEDYANAVKLVLKELNINKYIIISHSFGSRVAIYLANSYNKVDKLIITGGAGIRPKQFKIFLRKTKYKIIKFFNKNAVVGSKDYIGLSSVMKKTFSNIVSKDLSDLAKNIKCKTLLIYGSLDRETPLYMAKKYNKLIKNSKLKIYKNFGHFAYIQNSEEFVRDCLIFIKE